MAMKMKGNFRFIVFRERPRMTRRFTSIVLACAALAAAAPALASSQATATIDHLTFTLYDLNPTDDIAPSFRFLTDASQTGATSTTAVAGDSFLGENGTDSLTRNKAFVARVADVTLANALGVAVVQEYSVAAHGQAAGTSTSFNASATTSAGYNNNYYGNSLVGGLEVSANTLLIIRADAKVSASVNAPGCADQYYYCYNSDNASAGVTMGLSFNSTDGTTTGSGSFSSQLNANVSANYTSTYEYDPALGYYHYVYTASPATSDKSDVLSVAFTNNTDLTQRGYFSLAASVSGMGNSGSGVGAVPIGTTVTTGAVPAAMSVMEATSDYTTYGLVTSVPEPQTWLTMLTGLFATTLVVRRARRG
jgi:hypothetical protein